MDVVASINFEMYSVMERSGGKNQQGRSSLALGAWEFYFRDKSFDGLVFIYDHFNLNSDVEKTKLLGLKKCSIFLELRDEKCRAKTSIIRRFVFIYPKIKWSKGQSGEYEG